MVTGTLVLDVLLPADVSSLKGKRSHVRRLVAELRRRFPVSAAETGGQQLHRRTQLGVAVVGSDGGYVGQVLDGCERLVAEHPELAVLAAHRQLFTDHD